MNDPHDGVPDPVEVTDHDSASSSPSGGMPAAVVEDRTRMGLGLVWLVPLAAIVVTSIVGWRAWQSRGIRVTVDFPLAHGLRAGDPVRSLGVDVGVVRDVSIVGGAGDSHADRPGSPAVRVDLSVDRDARDLLRADSRFWIQRPQVDFGGVEGLDTLTGSRYVGLDPGSGRAILGPFSGLAAPPVTTDDGGDADGLDVVLESRDRAGMRPGGTVVYRGLVVGRILDVDLSSDARRIEARVRIDAKYAPLVRDETRFFSTSGIGLELGFQGLRADIESLESVVSGGVGFATPPDAGDRSVTGARFDLAERPDPVWLAWQPRIALGPLGVAEPMRRRAVLRYRVGLLGRERTRSGWAVPGPSGDLLLPATLVDPPSDARDAVLEIGGQATSLADLGAIVGTDGLKSGPPVARIPRDMISARPELLAAIGGDEAPSPTVAGAMPGDEVTLLVHRDPGSDPLPVPGHRWHVENGGILIDAGTGLTDIDDGAPVTDGSTGRFIGVLVVTDDGTRVAVPAAP